MQKYLHYHPDDFVWDNSFRQWVLSPTRESDAFWQQWLATHPDKTATVQQARNLVLALRLEESDLSEEEIRYTVQRTSSRIKKNQVQDWIQPQPEPRIFSFYRQTWFRMAATLVLVSGLSVGAWKTWFTPSSSLNPERIGYQALVEDKALTETVNRSAKPMPVKLSDGSLIILKPGSQVSYLPSFNGARREVYLSGEGFFEVTKNPDKPFLIYANGLVTKVLGTSFSIRAYPEDPDVTVEVKTGRVAVFAQSDPGVVEKTGSRELAGVVLTPNQKIVYVRDEVRLTKSLVDEPQVVSTAPVPKRFEFEDTPVPAVFDELEGAYGVDLVYDEILLANCPLTVTLTEQPLFEKLDIICRVIEARYELIDGQIVIYSRGCKP